MLRGLALLALLAVLAGCEKESKPLPAAAPTPAPQTVPDPEWRAVIEDWYDNGTFDDAHACAAVRKAIASVPKRDYSPPLEDFETYAALVCGDA